MNEGNFQKNNFRYERKFFIENTDISTIESIVKSNIGFFKEIHKARWINNVYFDFIEFDNFMDNVVGSMYRKKYRIRWYGDMLSNISNPTLELKTKRGLLGDKKSYPLESLCLEIGLDSSIFQNVIKNSKLDSFVKFQLEEQVPVMLNRYRRKYYESFDKRFRITLDSDQSFHRIHRFKNQFLERKQDVNNIILEIKYDERHDLDAAKITNCFPFRLTKSSKYSKGIEYLYF